MPAFPVLQPDGRLAIYSTVVDHFTAFDCSVQEAVEEVSRRHGGDVETAVKEVAAGRIPYPHFETWVDCVAWAMFMHGEYDRGVTKALVRSPDDRDKIYQKVRAYRADDDEEL